jgi:hypothetical protein
MSKYMPLARHLRQLRGQEWQATFDDVEAVLGFSLPQSAFLYQAWWANQQGMGHSQTRGWQDAGWRTADLDLERRRVRFVRDPAARSMVMDSGAGDPPATRDTAQDQSDDDAVDDFWKEAARLTRISDRRELERAAAIALVEKEAARVLATLGGTMPEAEAGNRRRFD